MIPSVDLSFGEKRPAAMSYNWTVEGLLTDPNLYGLVNAGIWDGNTATVEYAGYCTVGDKITQVSAWKPIHQDIKYKFQARLGGTDAIGNIVGVKFYAVDAVDANNMTLLVDLNQTIAANQTWYTKEAFFTATASQHLKKFKAVCYIDQGTGGTRGTACAYFDYVRIDANEFLTCQSKIDYNYGVSPLENDLFEDCRVDYKDFEMIAETWLNSENPEPAVNTGELLANADFYANLSAVPSNGNFVAQAPTGWQFVPTITDPNVAGIMNLDRDGLINAPGFGYQPAGGSVAAYIDPNTELRQSISSPAIVNGQKYYLSAMMGGNAAALNNIIHVIWEYVDNPATPTSVTQIAEANYILPVGVAWRLSTREYTANAAAAGKYFRVRFDYEKTIASAYDGYAYIGSASITTAKPAVWPRTNLLTNGDFEDYSNLQQGSIGDGYGWINLMTFNGYTMWDPAYPNEYPLGWTPTSTQEGGMQCMLWAAAPQFVQGRISAWFGDSARTEIIKLEQKVTSETIQNGQTYYLDFVAAIAASYFNSGDWIWPDVDPNLVVDLYWLAAGQSDLSGTKGVHWDLITSLKTPVDGSLGAHGGHWQTASTSFTAGSSLAGKSFYVSAYCDNALTPWSTFEEIYLSKTPRPQVGPYTCYEARNVYGLGQETDLNNDCVVDVKDIAVFVTTWLDQI